jgi:XTP/dITP diphosphohydrolase
VTGQLDRLRVACASANPDKVAELASLLDGVVELVPRPTGLADVVEDADTLEGNARLKAVAVCAAAVGLPAVADDTGLEVDHLGGGPGVHTARFAGERATYADNRARLLHELDRVPAERRTARFRTVVLVRWPDGTELVAEGVCEGHIAEEERGARGFGYDSIFVPAEGDGRTFAEMDEAEKHQLSHRGRAVALMAAQLAERSTATVTTKPR